MKFITSNYNEFVIVEGYLRMTAYAMVPQCFNNVNVIVGQCDGGDWDLWM